ncbi:transcription factor bHLH147 [Cajanus cajan]|uniref:Transcription factor bHLH147 family n=1 Tax=Cajanus cajan TaxID=3821 RepID=A0A151T651_CAJCA|nr:transcription factor bHLH147 [Cajanus cajan]KYP62505.1 Transcription factor bHLH147 family [Cajanus cajan]
MSSSLTANPTLAADRSRDSHRTKKKKKSPTKHTPAKWKSHAQQHLYSTKLHQALRRVNISGDAPRRGKAVREAADRVLAVAARGRTRWSRAILTHRLKLKFRKPSHKRHKVVGPARPKKPRFGVLRLKAKTLPAVQRKVRFLGRLVPGCRKEPLPVILEEAIDYIPALEMQVRAMAALADLLLGSSSSASAAASTSSPPN